jgi:fibronectin-binding autotransporter adhesin
MAHRGHIGKAFVATAMAVASLLLSATRTWASAVTWNKGGDNSTYTTNLMSPANWNGGFPGNGSNVFMVWNRGNAGGANTITVTNAGSDKFFADSLSISNVSVQKSTVILNLFGQTFLTNNAGSLLFAGAVDAGGGTPNNISLRSFSNVTFNIATFVGQTGSGNATLNFAGGSVVGSNLTFTGAASGAGINSLIIGTTLNLSSNLVVSGGNANNTVLISNSMATVAGRLSVAGNQTDQYFKLTNATLTVSNGVLNTGKIDILNLGSLNVTRDWINNGVLNIAAGGNVVSTTGNTLTNQGNGVITTVGGFIKSALVNQGSMSFGGTISNAFLQTAGTNTLSGNATITGSATISGGILDIAGNKLSNQLLTLSGTGLLTNGVSGGTVNGGVSNAATVFVSADTFFDGAVTNAGTFVFRGAVSNDLVDSGTVRLNNAATITQTATANAGTFTLAGNDLRVGQLAMTGGVFSNTGSARLILAGNATGNPSAATAVITGGILDLAGSTRTFNIADGAATLDMQISAVVSNGGLTKTGAGVLELTGANKYAGGTTISNGTLRIDNTTGSGTGTGAISIESGGTLGGTGAVSGAVTVKAGGTLAPGNSVGTFAVGTLALQPSSALQIELAGLSSYDKLTLTGSATLGGNLDIVLLGGYTPSANDSFTIITAAGGVTGTFDTITAGYEVEIVGNSVVLSLIPEPGALTLTACGILLLLAVCRARGRRAPPGVA